jgi:TPP-dependent indolepyruvate ferredoxin oxidoreductase alpha subunit
MKKKNIKLCLRKSRIASFDTKMIRGGAEAYSPPITVEPDVCQPSDICSDDATCPFVCITMREDACYTDKVLSCEPYVCGDVG